MEESIFLLAKISQEVYHEAPLIIIICPPNLSLTHNKIRPYHICYGSQKTENLITSWSFPLESACISISANPARILFIFTSAEFPVWAQWAWGRWNRGNRAIKFSLTSLKPSQSMRKVQVNDLICHDLVHLKSFLEESQNVFLSAISSPSDAHAACQIHTYRPALWMLTALFRISNSLAWRLQHQMSEWVMMSHFEKRDPARYPRFTFYHQPIEHLPCVQYINESRVVK